MGYVHAGGGSCSHVRGPRPPSGSEWRISRVRGIGPARFLADLGHEILTALLLGFLTSTRGASATPFGLIQGLAHGAADLLSRFGGGPLADDLGRRRSIAVSRYTTIAVLSTLVGIAGVVWHVAVFRLAYAGLATGNLMLVIVAFIIAGVAIGYMETAENAIVASGAPPVVRGSAFGLLPCVESPGNVATNAIAGLLSTALSPSIAFLYLAGGMDVRLFLFGGR